MNTYLRHYQLAKNVEIASVEGNSSRNVTRSICRHYKLKTSYSFYLMLERKQFVKIINNTKGSIHFLLSSPDVFHNKCVHCQAAA